MEWVTIIDNENDVLNFNMAIEETIVGVVIFHSKGEYFWTLSAESSGKSANIHFTNGEFIETTKGKIFSKEESKEINKGFYELFKRIKQNTKYRLKVINMINDEIRKAWEAI